MLPTYEDVDSANALQKDHNEKMQNVMVALVSANNCLLSLADEVNKNGATDVVGQYTTRLIEISKAISATTALLRLIGFEPIRGGK